MSQYKTGTATVTNGSATVTGTNTLWLANVTAGNSFTVAGDGVMYDVASVDSDTQITLSAPYAGTTASGVVYAIGTGFIVPDSFPEMSQGDIETATIFTRAMRGIQGKFKAVASIAGSGYNFLGDYTSGIELTEYNQVLRESGEFWRVSASTTLPYTTTGAGMPESGAFVNVGDAVLRQDLASDASGKGASLVSMEGGPTVESAIGGKAAIAGQTFTGDIAAPGITATGSFTSLGIDDNATSTAITIDSDENVGIGTSSPQVQLDITSNTGGIIRLSDSTASTNVDDLIGRVEFYTNDFNANRIGAYIQSTNQEMYGLKSDLRFGVTKSNNANATEAMRIRESGNVGVGTETPAEKLDVDGSIRASTGILFGTDTAAANTLDDYEEGTFTFATGGGLGSLTISGTSWYFKIGNLVTFGVRIDVSGAGTGSGDVYFTGLPFNPSSTSSFRPSCSIYIFNLASAVDGYVTAFINTNDRLYVTEGGLTGTVNDFGSYIQGGTSMFISGSYTL